MKVNELMIGDWVYSTFCDKPCKVIGIEQYEGGYVNVKVTNVTGAKDINSIYFIPLTAEILEKSGFEVHRQFATFTEYWLDIPRKVVRIAPNSYIEIYNGENKNVHIDGKVYVHELQHALILCGINKKIVL